MEDHEAKSFRNGISRALGKKVVVGNTAGPSRLSKDSLPGGQARRDRRKRSGRPLKMFANEPRREGFFRSAVIVRHSVITAIEGPWIKH